MELSDFQIQILSIPEEFDIFLGGGRGGAKSYSLALLALRHAEQYRERARVLYIRKTYKGLADFEDICRFMFARAYGRGLKYNATEHIFRLPSGAYVELGQLETPQDYAKYQGRSFTLLLVDEAGQYASAELLDRLRSNLRGPKDIPIRMAMAANPGDVGHSWIAKRYVFKTAPWVPFHEENSRRTWLYAPSTYLDNPHIDREQYRNQLESSCPSDPELLRAWLEGDWAVARGAYFGGCLEESRNAVDPWPWVPAGWNTYLAHDFGSSAPSVTYLVCASPGGTAHGKYYPRDSLILIDEFASNEPNNLDKGMGYTVPTLAEHIKDMCKRWKRRPRGVADDAIFSFNGSAAGSISDEFRRAGVYFLPARKAERIGGWNVLRRLMADAGKPDLSGMYISRSCEYFWATVPYLGRDPRRIEDLDSRGVDHAADAARYACLKGGDAIQVMKVKI